jgi:hypothetical protein
LNRPIGCFAGLLDQWRDALMTETVPEMLCVGLRLLARFGTSADASLGRALVSADAPEVAQAGIGVLFAHDRTNLAAALALTLGHSNPDIRFHAIRRLGLSMPLKPLNTWRPQSKTRIRPYGEKRLSS